MKITMPLKQLRNAVEKASIAALTKDAQDEERKKTKPTDSCVIITATKDNIIFESTSDNISVLHSIPKDENIVIEQKGSFCTEASHYLQLLNTLSADKYLIQISYEENNKYAKDASIEIIKPNGKIFTTVIDKITKYEKRTLIDDTFPISEFARIDYKHNTVLFSIKAKYLKEGIDRIIFATDSKDPNDMFDNVSIYAFDNKIHFAGTDGKRCAIYSVDEMDAIVEENNQVILINGLLLKKSYEPFDADEIIDVIDCGNKHVILSSGDTKVRLNIGSEELKHNFPDINRLSKSDFPTSIVVSNADLLEAINFLSHYTTERLTIYATKGETDIKIEAVNRGKEPDDLANALVQCNEKIMDLHNPIILKLQHLQAGVKKITGKQIKISFSKNEQKIRMESTKNNRFIYIFQAIKSTSDNTMPSTPLPF